MMRQKWDKVQKDNDLTKQWDVFIVTFTIEGQQLSSAQMFWMDI